MSVCGAYTLLPYREVVLEEDQRHHDLYEVNFLAQKSYCHKTAGRTESYNGNRYYNVPDSTFEGGRKAETARVNRSRSTVITRSPDLKTLADELCQSLFSAKSGV